MTRRVGNMIYVIKTDEILLKKNRYEFSSAFIDQRLLNMVQRLFAEILHTPIWRHVDYLTIK
jgi:hypothetical protein